MAGNVKCRQRPIAQVYCLFRAPPFADAERRHASDCQRPGKPGHKYIIFDFAAKRRNIKHRDPLKPVVVADMIIMGMRRNNRHRQLRKRLDDRFYVSYPGTRIKQDGALLTQQQIVVVQLPIARFADCERYIVNPGYGIPVIEPGSTRAQDGIILVYIGSDQSAGGQYQYCNKQECGT